jgi:hypothetical protein
MIETFKSFGLASGAARKGAAPRIRALSWREIVARLDGTRELRRIFSQSAERGSFAPAAACRIALLEHGLDQGPQHGGPERGRLAVNPAGLGNLKPGDGTGVLVTNVRETAI